MRSSFKGLVISIVFKYTMTWGNNFTNMDDDCSECDDISGPLWLVVDFNGKKLSGLQYLKLPYFGSLTWYFK